MRLFEFLSRAQQLKNQPPRTVETYQSVLWLGDLPHHRAVIVAHRGGDPAPDDALLSIDRVPRLDPPPPHEPLREWLTGPLDDPDRAPELRDTITMVDEVERTADTTDPDRGTSSRQVSIDDRPDIHDEYEQWRIRWQGWADQELLDRPIRTLYGQLFSTYVTATGNPEQLELVVGIGCLAWTPPGHPPVKRHLITAPVAIAFHEDTGRLTVERVPSIDAASVELDMLDPGLTGSHHINDIRDKARVLEAHPLHHEEVGSLVRRLVHTLDAEGEYQDRDDAPGHGAHAVAAFAPALILRKRSQQGLVEIFQTIVRQLTEAGHVPDGVLPLIDPDHRPTVAGAEPVNGALTIVDDDPFLPLPVNDTQLRIIRQVDTNSQTLVQGPPGTGKTHTAAALLSHLLAQGKRVLVTAHTDRALKEVRDKLPAAIKPLSVAVVGTSREDMSDLKVAVERIAASAADHDPRQSLETIRTCLGTIDELRRHRADRYRQLIRVREDEVNTYEHAGYRGTLAAVAQQHRTEADQFGWLEQYAQVPSDASIPLHNGEIIEWRGYLLDTGLAADEPESNQRLLDLATVADPADFAKLVAAERLALANRDRHSPHRRHPAFDAVHRLDAPVRRDLQHRLHGLAKITEDLTRRREAWMSDALSDVRSGRARVWQARARNIADLIGRAAPLVEHLDQLTEVAAEGDLAPLVGWAKGVLEHLAGGGKLKTASDGTPRLGAFTAKAFKQAEPLFRRVRVDGLPPTTPDHLNAFITWADATKILAALDRAWPEAVGIPKEDTLHERFQWHITELEQLDRVLGLADALAAEERTLAELELPQPNWTDVTAVRAYAALVDAAGAVDALTAATLPLQRIEETLVKAAQRADAAPCVHRMLLATCQRDHNEYAEAHKRLGRLHDVRRTTQRRDALAARLTSAAPALRQAVAETAADSQWRERLAGFAQAWEWAAAGTWLRERDAADVNVLQAEIALTEEQIRHQVETLAATRAWSHAVSPQRLTGQARANLEQYAYLVRRLGKGTGKYAVQQRAEIRQAMDRCRPAVPVWIMPIYRIAEQLQIQPNMFDVVIVDEASQAGLEATFLQYLAPKIVVIGDDKQVSPTAVGVDQQQLRDLAGQYLHDDPYRASWQDPQRSLFDEAKMRFSGLLTLTEHRRCVPEIIGFSNRIAYEPDGIRLIPVRQYGADRLEPIKAVFVPDGYTRGTTYKVNPAEVDAIVDQIEKCLADPRYDGLTFGVISLLGTAQATAIEKKLLERIPPAEWASRQLRCGDSANFQGSERDIMFLSMVAAVEPGKRLGALTRDQYVQRYNVAASRAKDQMWLFHSIALSDVANPDDMRFQLLDYCYGVINRAGSSTEGGLGAAVPDDRRVKPFDSLFEQRVYNRLYDRGYTIIPQYPVEPYKIDLVVIGARTRLAIECDGDTWHGPEAYEGDLARQRDLERCGWRFFRIRESAFYVDQAAALDELWSTMRELEIHPSGWIPEDLADGESSEEGERFSATPPDLVADDAATVDHERQSSAWPGIVDPDPLPAVSSQESPPVIAGHAIATPAVTEPVETKPRAPEPAAPLSPTFLPAPARQVTATPRVAKPPARPATATPRIARPDPATVPSPAIRAAPDANAGADDQWVPVPTGFRSVAWVRPYEALAALDAYAQCKDVPVRFEGKVTGWVRYYQSDSPDARHNHANVVVERASASGAKSTCWLKQHEAKAIISAAKHRRDTPVENSRWEQVGLVQYFPSTSEATRRFQSVTRLLRFTGRPGAGGRSG
ncbi:AAA domain-containing protein [Dactylosporangium sp. NBC_01737]|uniref:AAA domain-containing protein n=1 Tax=Dactylosporangium sp. NBC_01737 TaxID=2975959 RepID=UPI002E10C871|nr:AAA domain-containing protein [Dactylosporangium sp. NBC_01737]